MHSQWLCHNENALRPDFSPHLSSHQSLCLSRGAEESSMCLVLSPPLLCPISPQACEKCGYGGEVVKSNIFFLF
ncbi:MAG: hypothetical protein V7L23_09665 [Nostoc sp.]|uniref:hypothetical protein n=1 Tax=Nostoc sp. TaxID=1180 RepID=UPI002FEFDF56